MDAGDHRILVIADLARQSPQPVIDNVFIALSGQLQLGEQPLDGGRKLFVEFCFALSAKDRATLDQLSRQLIKLFPGQRPELLAVHLAQLIKSELRHIAYKSDCAVGCNMTLGGAARKLATCGIPDSPAAVPGAARSTSREQHGGPLITVNAPEGV